ncbi:MAG: preprotein translocase subunit SecE [Candidatus Margulisiibacteriota bacterium]
MNNIQKKIVDYVKETRAEVKKVTWPDRRYVTAATIIILLIVIVFAVFIMILDWGLARLFMMITRTV